MKSIELLATRMIVVIVDTDDDQQKLRKNAVESILRPTSAENLANNILKYVGEKGTKEAQRFTYSQNTR